MTHNMLTPEDAAQYPCPIARTFADQKQAVTHCRGQACILWRWETIMAGDARWKKAVAAEAERLGEKAPFAKAARAVADDPVKYELVSTHGWCGLAAIK